MKNLVNDVYAILATAEEALSQAEAVRFAALHAVEEARKAVKLKEADVAAELLLHAAEVAAKAIKDAELKALESWEGVVKRSLERAMQ